VRELSTAKLKLPYHRSAGLSAQASCWESTSIMLYAATAVSCGLLEHRWMAMTRHQGPCPNTTAATGMGVFSVFQMPQAQLSATVKLEKNYFLQQRNTQELSA